jgi:REP element-mobilizing transposase RayT
MARQPRIEFPGALYHTISRGNHGQMVFRAPADYACYCQLLERYQDRYAFRLYAYVLMPTHVHLLVETGEIPLSKIMQGLQQTYTGYFNRRYRVHGHLFQGRYKALLCQKDAYLLALVRYLHLNPVRAGLVRTPEAYRWSSHRCYLDGHDRGGVTVAPVLGQFGRTRTRAVEAYRRFVHAGKGQGHRPEFYEGTDQRLLGDERFLEEVDRRLRPSGPRRPVPLSLPQVAALVSQATGVARDELISPGRGRAAALTRALVASLARMVGDIPLTEAAEYLRRDPATLSLGIRRLQERQTRDRALREVVRRLRQALRGEGQGKRVGKYKDIKV